MKLTDALLQSHSQLRQIVEAWLSSEDLHHQCVYFEQLWQQFLVHEQAEAYIVFRVINDAMIQNPHFNEQSLDFAVNEHHYFEDFVEHIAAMPQDAIERPKLIKELICQIESHMQHEEAYIFPRFAQQLTDEQHAQMVAIYLEKCREYNKQLTPKYVETTS